jgi:hypothetical protein
VLLFRSLCHMHGMLCLQQLSRMQLLSPLG